MASAPHDDEILVSGHDGRREGTGNPIIPIPIGNADGHASERNAARIATKRPFWVVSRELVQPLFKLGLAVLKEQDVWVAQDNEVARASERNEVIAAKGVEPVRFTIVDIEISQSAGVKPWLTNDATVSAYSPRRVTSVQIENRGRAPSAGEVMDTTKSGMGRGSGAMAHPA